MKDGDWYNSPEHGELCRVRPALSIEG